MALQETQLNPLTSKALARRLKKRFKSQCYQYFAVSPVGLEGVLEREVQNLPHVLWTKVNKGGVEYCGPLESIYTSNLFLRSANRILLRVDRVLSQSFPMLYNKSRSIPWETYIGFHPTFAIRASARKSKLNMARRIETTIEKAIYTRLQGIGLVCERVNFSAIEFYVRIFQDRCIISINTSGGHLHNRGFQTKVGTAPIRGTLAASTLTLSEAFDHDLVLDPFCGSGTLLIEGVYIAHNVPPGMNRQFSFEAAPFYKESAWNRIRSDAKRAIRASETRFIGVDILKQSIEDANFNVEQTGLSRNISLFQRDALKCNLAEFVKDSKRTLIVSNLPYGKRIGNSNSVPTLLLTFFRKIRQELPGCHYAFITKHPGLLTQAGIPPEKTLHSSNGGLAVTIALGKIPERS